MKKLKQFFAVMLVFSLVFTGLPTGIYPLKAFAADPTVIKTDDDWKAFAGGNDTNAVLGADITLSGEIPVRKNFSSGTFDGKGYTITIADGSYFGAGYNNSVGLFAQIAGRSTVKNLNVLLKGNLYDAKERTLGDSGYYHVGVIAGNIADSTIQDCAVIRSSTTPLSNGLHAAAQTSIGGIVGRANESIIQGNYLDISVAGYGKHSGQGDPRYRLSVGGLVGSADGYNSIQNNFVYYSSLRAYHQWPSFADHTYAKLGGIVGDGTNAIVSNNLVRGTDMHMNDYDESKTTQSYKTNSHNIVSEEKHGTIYLVSPITGANNYAVSNSMSNPSGKQISNGVITDSNSAKNYFSGRAEWVTANSGFQMPKGVVKIGPEIKLKHIGNNAKSDIEIKLDPEKDNDAQWQFNLTAKSMGQMGTATGATVTETTSQEKAVTSIAINESRTDGGDTHYASGEYQFYAEVGYKGYTEGELPIVNWSVDNSNKATISNTGLLEVKAGATGTITITAKCGETGKEKTATKTITITPITNKLDITTKPTTVYKGGSYAFGATATGDSSFINSTFTWSVTGGKIGTTINFTTGILTVAEDETATSLTVKISGTGSYSNISKDVIVNVSNPPEPTNKNVTINVGEETVDNTAITINGLDTVTFTSETGTDAPNPEATTVYTVDSASAGSIADSIFTASDITTQVIATITATQTYTIPSVEPATEPTTEKLTGTVNVTVNPRFEIATPEELVRENVVKNVMGDQAKPDYKPSAADIVYTVKLAGGKSYKYILGGTDPGDTWKGYDSAKGIILSPEEVTKMLGGGINLWVKTEPDSDDMADSETVKFILTGAGVAGIDGTGDYIVKSAIDPKIVSNKTVNYDKDSMSVSTIIGAELGLAPGEVSVSVKPSGIACHFKDNLVLSTSSSIAVGEVTLKPTIRPREDGVMIDDKFTIDVPEGTKVYYKIIESKDKSQITVDEYPNNQSNLYAENAMIPLPTDKDIERVTVLAIAYSPDEDNKAPSAVDMVTFTKQNLYKPAKPTLKLGKDKYDYSNSGTYSDDTEIHFEHSRLSDTNFIYYTTNGSTPTQTGNGVKYVESSPRTLNFGTNSSIKITTIFFDNDRGVQSDPIEYIVQKKGNIGLPVASIKNNSAVKPGETLYLHVGETVANQISDSYGVSANYSDPYDAENDPYKDYELVGTEKPIEGTSYLIINTADGNMPALPTIRYLINDSTGDIERGSAYQYSICHVYHSEVDNNIINYVKYTNPDKIVLDKISSNEGNFDIRLKVFSENTQLGDSAESRFIYKLRGAVSAPTAIPNTSIDNIKEISIGEKISLIGDAGSSIYYTIDGTLPSVTWNEETKVWEINTPEEEDPTTFLFDSRRPIIPMEDDQLFTINAIAVSTKDELESTSALPFVYSVKKLDQSAIPNAIPNTSTNNVTSLQFGSTIELTTTTLNADIYYTIDGTIPSVTDRDSWDTEYAKATDKGEDADTGKKWYMSGADKILEVSTMIYNPQKPIKMAATQENMLFTVTAITKEKTVPPKLSQSDAVSFTYKLAQAAVPTSVPATSLDNVTTVKPNTNISFFTTTDGASIYYTVDNTAPIVTPTVEEDYKAWLAAYNAATDKGTDALGRGYYTTGGNKVYEPSTKKYDPTVGIVMPKTVTTFFTIRAKTVMADEKLADSNVVTFPFQLPAPVQAVYASPGDGSAVLSGTEVTLRCSTEGATIFYKTYTKSPSEDDVPVANLSPSFNNPIVISADTYIKAIAVKDGMESVVATYHYKVAPTLSPPSSTLSPGSVVAKGTRISLNSSGSVAYTTDGTDPKAILNQTTISDKDNKSTVQYGNSITITGDYGDSVTVRAFSYGNGYTPSETVSYSYTVAEKDDYLKASPVSGSVVRQGDTISLITGVSNGSIFYTINGNSPTVINNYLGSDDEEDYYDSEDMDYEWKAGKGTVRGNSVTVTGNPGDTFIIKAISKATGSSGGAVQVLSYTIQEQTAAPTASIPTGAVVKDGAAVTLKVKEGSIYYTTDGSTPTTSSILYTTPIDASRSMVLKAIAVADNRKESDVVSYIYTRADQVSAPYFDIAGGEIDQGSMLEINCDTPGASIYYSTDGTDPSADNIDKLTLYSSPILVTRPVTIKVIATRKDLITSVVNTGTFTVKEPEIIIPEEDNSDIPNITNTDRLSTRRTYSDSMNNGPTYSDIIISDIHTNTVLSAEEDIVPRGSKLVVAKVGASSSDRKAVGRELGYDVAAVYDVTLEKDGDQIQPYGEVEIGLPIPSQYQNGIVVICRINDDGSLDAFPTRRVGGMGYVITDHFSKYAITVPQLDEALIFRLPLWGIVLIVALLLVIISLIIVLLRRRNKETSVVESALGAAEQISYDNLELFSFDEGESEISPEEVMPQDLDNKQ